MIDVAKAITAPANTGAQTTAVWLLSDRTWAAIGGF
jgi:hypothetical protein